MRTDRTRRPAIVAARPALLCAGLLLLAPNLALAQPGYAKKPIPYGLGSTIKNDPQTQPLDLTSCSNPYINIIGFQIHWSDIQPGPDQFNWQRLDQFFDAARASHKWVHLMVFCGFFTPAWVLQKAETDWFTVPY
jgi:hypothetical protein